MTDYTPRDLRDAWVDYRTGDESFDEYKDYAAANASFDQIMAKQNEPLTTLIEEIKAIHREVDLGEAGPSECFEDVEHWPCRTIEAVRKAEA